MDGIQIASAIFLILMLVFLFPRAKQMFLNSPKAESGDWNAVLLPLLGVIGFVILLIWLVGQ
tara:strand:- start:793 stop:978 length:186 start_codon:yes stop_codon:yes gene_type:complete